MVWPKLSYSKSEINRAGRILVDSTTPVVVSFDLEQFIWAFEVVNNWRSCHGYPLNTFQATLRQKLKLIDADALVAQRLKRMPSIIEKLRRLDGMQLARMQDIGGLRAVVPALKKVRMLEENYRSSRFQYELVTSRDYITYPKTSGYRSVHLIYRYKNQRAPEYRGLLLELQVRTRLQHAWATAVETMGMFLDHALKSSEGPDLWLDFFSLIEKLLAFTIAAERVHTDMKSGSYHLIVLYPTERRVMISSYGQGNLETASRDYSDVERQIANGKSMQAVLVSAGPIEQLRRAYPNYFLDTREFVAQLARIEKHVKTGVGLA